MEVDTPLTDLFVCPWCGFKGLFKAEPVAYVKCICGSWWVIGDYEYYLSLTFQERDQIKVWDINLYKDHRELNRKDWRRGFYS